MVLIKLNKTNKIYFQIICIPTEILIRGLCNFLRIITIEKHFCHLLNEFSGFANNLNLLSIQSV